MKLLRPLIPFLAVAWLVPGSTRADRDADLAAVAAAASDRSETMIGTHVTRPFPAPAPDPASPALGNAAYALAALWQDTDRAGANARLVDVRDGAYPDEYWAMGQLVRCHMLFACDSPHRPGRMTPDAEQAVRDVVRRHLDLYSRVAEASEPTAWIIDDSENHDIMRRSVNLLGAAMLAHEPSEAPIPLADGALPADHHAAWSGHFVRYLQERARKGLFVEHGSPTYAKYTLQSVFNLRDFAESQDVRDLAGKLLDLYFAETAQEQLGGVRGGAKSRSYHDQSSATGTSDSVREYLHLLAGAPPSLPLTRHPSAMCAATSDYRMPRVVMDLVLHPEDKGSYAYVSTAPARGTRTTDPAPNSTFWYEARFPSRLLRTTLATPGWIAGTATVDPTARYMEIHSQNRWSGVVFAGSVDSRVYAQCEGTASGGRTAYDETSGIAEGDAMVVQRLASGSGGALRVYFSSDLAREEESGWVFARDPAGTGYVGVRPARGTAAWDPPDAMFPGGSWLRPSDPDTPFVFQLGLSTDFAGDFAAFKARTVANALSWPAPDQLSYVPTTGRPITWFTDARPPLLDAVALELDPVRSMSSPYLDWTLDALRGTVTATSGYGGRALELDFALPPGTPSRIVLEAESGAIEPPMTVAADGAASGRAFVHVPDSPGNSGGAVRFTVTTTAAGTWTLWARLFAGDGGSNSFFESVDGEAPLVLGNGPAAGTWQWVRGATRMLDAGAHELAVLNREDGTRIDQIVMTTGGDDAAPATVTRRAADTDGDGVPDAWTQAVFSHATGLPGDASRAGDDGDGDGETVLQEHRAGTDPHDGADYLAIRLGKSAGLPSIRFATRVASGPECPPPRRTYVVTTSTDARGPFASVSGLDALPAGAPLDVALPGGTALDFYRVDAVVR